MPGFAFILHWEDLFFFHYPFGLNASVPHLEVELESEQVWLCEKQVNDFTASVEILSARGGDP